MPKRPRRTRGRKNCSKLLRRERPTSKVKSTQKLPRVTLLNTVPP